MHPQCVRDEQQVAELHLGARLHALDGASIDAGLLGQAFLGHVHVQPAHADAVADGPAGVEDPLRVIGCWHPTNALMILVACQQQN